MPRFSTMFSSAAVALCLSSAALAENIIVTVGGPGGVTKFDPQFVNASIGDTVSFQFQQKNHTVTQSSLADPCSPLAGGFDTGFIPVDASVTSDFPHAELLVSDTDPTWVYCRQAGHCAAGMVFAINPADKFGQFLAAATGGAADPTTSAADTATTSAPAAASVVTVTATVTVSGSVATTTYATTASSAAASAASSGSTTATSTDHKVVVGGTAGLVFTPSNITAQPGDTISFEFHSKNHTVTASSFPAPCNRLPGGFDSGFMPVDTDAVTFPTYTIQVNDTKPIWAYCRQATHCGQGMTFSVNAPETGNTFTAFQENAKKINGTGTTGYNATTDGAAGSSIGSGILIASLATVLGSLL